jgi:hypothetical protein
VSGGGSNASGFASATSASASSSGVGTWSSNSTRGYTPDSPFAQQLAGLGSISAVQMYSADQGHGSDVVFQTRIGQDLTVHNDFYARRGPPDDDFENDDSGYYTK